MRCFLVYEKCSFKQWANMVQCVWQKLTKILKRIKNEKTKIENKQITKMA